MPSIAEQKTALRPVLRARRRAAACAGPWSCVVIPPLGAIKVLASYRPIAGEADPASVARHIDAATLCFPRIGSDGSIDFAQVASAGDWRDGPYGLLQPAMSCPALTPDAILVPLLGFDRRGSRLGQGGGYYDRALAAYPQATTIGIAWAVQEETAIPVESWDRRLHHIVTEKEWISL